ncbi:hypothetical protein D3C78_1425890 [compost metagenome]
MSHGQYVGSFACTHVVGLTGHIGVDSGDGGIDDIINKYEVATFLAVFENIHIFALQQQGRENREDACIGVLQRLSGTVHVLIAKRYRSDSQGGAAGENQLFLHLLCNAIDRARMYA